jgi:hypothetical protein
MKCQEAEDLLVAHNASAEAYLLAIHSLIEALGASRVEFWSAIKIAEAAKDDWHSATKALNLHIARHHCQKPVNNG